ncbi:MAG: histidine kinase [Bacteroidota bacterium]|nr:histidine kinase [Bacteroidota bacterium]
MKRKTIFLISLMLLLCTRIYATSVTDTLDRRMWMNLLYNVQLSKKLSPVTYKTDIKVELRGGASPQDKAIAYSAVMQFSPLIQSVKIDTVSSGGNLIIYINSRKAILRNSIVNGEIRSMTGSVRFRQNQTEKDKFEDLLFVITSLLVPRATPPFYGSENTPFPDSKFSSLTIDSLSHKNILRMKAFGVDSMRLMGIINSTVKLDKIHTLTIYSLGRNGLTPSDKFIIRTIYDKNADKLIKEGIIKYTGAKNYYLKKYRREYVAFQSYYPLFLKLLLGVVFIYQAFRRNRYKELLSYWIIGSGLYILISFYFDMERAGRGYEPFNSHFFNLWSVVSVMSVLLYILNAFILRKINIPGKVKDVILASVIFLSICLIFGQSVKMITTGILLSVLFIWVRRFIVKQSETLRLKDEELDKLQILKAQAELQTLQSRINPHFLFNSLNSISHLIHVDAGRAEKMTLLLSELFRYILNRDNKTLVPLSEEVAMVEKYLEIEKMRYEDKLSFKIETDEEARKWNIPRLIIQPLVENAIKHGISKQTEKGFIEISVQSIDNRLVISATDSGPDFPEIPSEGHGLQNIIERLQLIYGNMAELSWVNHPRKRITITILNRNK